MYCSEFSPLIGFQKIKINKLSSNMVKHSYEPITTLNFGTAKVKAVVDINSPLESVSPEILPKEHYFKRSSIRST